MDSALEKISETYTPILGPYPVVVQRISADVGKGLFTREPVGPDRVLFEEAPFASCPIPENEEYVISCGQCLAFLGYKPSNKLTKIKKLSQYLMKSPFASTICKCPFCDQQYCSTSCRDQAFSSHHALTCTELSRDKISNFTGEPTIPDWLKWAANQSVDLDQPFLICPAEDRADTMANLRKLSDLIGPASLSGGDARGTQKKSREPQLSNPMLLIRVFAVLYSAWLRGRAIGGGDMIEYEKLRSEFDMFVSSERFSTSAPRFPTAMRTFHDFAKDLFPDPLFHEQEMSLETFSRRFAQLCLNAQSILVEPPPPSVGGASASTSDFGYTPDSFFAKLKQLPKTKETAKLIDEFVKAGEGVSRPEVMWCPLGSGIYRIHATMNHSCEPTARVDFRSSNHCVTVWPTRPLAEGEQVCIAYTATEPTRRERNEYLLRYYGFLCKCTKCVREATVVTPPKK